MSLNPVSHLAQSKLLNWFAGISGSVVLITGLAGLIGWGFDIQILKSLMPGWVAMRANAALSFALCGLALLLLNIHPATPFASPGESNTRLVRVVALFSAGLAALIGLLTLSEYMIGWDLGIDQLLFRQPLDAMTVSIPGRMPPAAAFNFLLLGSALLLASGHRNFHLFQAFNVLGGLLGWLGLSQYLYGGEPLLPFAQLAAHAAVAFIVLSIGMLCLRADGGLMALLVSDSTSGMIARRLMPAALVIPIVLGWLRLQGQRQGLYGTEAGVSLLSLANLLAFGGLVWATAALLNRSDTERKRAESERAQFAAIVESSDDAIISKNLNGVITSWNRGAEKVFGYSPEEALGEPMLMLFPPERANEEPEILKLIARGERVDHFESVRIRKDGERIDVSVTISPVSDDRGEIIGASKIARDITEQKHAEQRIQAQLARLDLLSHTTRAIGERQDLRSIFQVVIRTLEDSLPIDFGCICLYDSVAEILTVTGLGVKSEPLAIELSMTEKSEIPIDENGLSRCVRGELVYEPDISAVEFPFPRRLAREGLRSLVIAPLLVESQVFGVLIVARHAASAFSSTDCEFLRQLSEHVAMAAHQAQIYAALEQAYDDLRQTQQAIMQQERLRALGQMASGIAHDINNAISPVTLYTEALLEQEPNLSERGRGFLETISRAIEDVAATVTRMREFYRQREPQLTLAPVDMNSLVKQVIDLTRARWNDMSQQRGIVINLQADLASDVRPVMAVESEIREALTNLIFNAVDAMPDGGTLTLRTRLAGNATSPSEASKTVQVEVSDTGVGMDEDTLQRCKEPFFTTKGERGTGLGLAMVYGVAERHSAELEIDSAPGIGTTVRLTFNVHAAMEAEPEGARIADTALSYLRILVVDDDPVILKSLKDTLEIDGHQVITANGGQAGIERFLDQTEHEPFEIVITDLGMPYVDGRQVAGAIKKASPDTPVILLTGWGQRMIADGDIPPHVDRVLSKPPKLRDLRAALAACRSTEPA